MTADEKLDLLLEQVSDIKEQMSDVKEEISDMKERVGRIERRLEAAESQAVENRDLFGRIEEHMKKIRQMELKLAAFIKNFSDALNGLTGWVIDIRERLNMMTH